MVLDKSKTAIFHFVYSGKFSVKIVIQNELIFNINFKNNSPFDKKEGDFSKRFLFQFVIDIFNET